MGCRRLRPNSTARSSRWIPPICRRAISKVGPAPPSAPSIRPPLIVCRGLAALIELSVGAHASAQHHLEQALTAQPKPQEPELFIKLGEACDAQATPEGYDAALQVTAPQHNALPKTDDSLRLPAL